MTEPLTKSKITTELKQKSSVNVSFYLLTPDAKDNSQLYASVSLKKNSATKRIRFATGYSLLTKYCHTRSKKDNKGKRKPNKDLVKGGTIFTLEYNTILTNVKERIETCTLELIKSGQVLDLKNLRTEYEIKAGLLKVSESTLETAFKSFMKANNDNWKGATHTKAYSTLKHLEAFQTAFGIIKLNEINLDTWDKLKNEYFVKTEKLNNSTTNKYLSFFRQFIRYCKKQKFITHEIDFDECEYLDTVEPFKIALKENEVETLLKLDLSNNPRLEKVRDLFYLEIMTGQRFSDIPHLLNKKNILENSISIYQEKTEEKVNIPIHPKLKKHLKRIFDKYPSGLPVISNQKFNKYLHEICELAGFDREHEWKEKVGNKLIIKTEKRFNLVGSHTGRRTFCTLAKKSDIGDIEIMKVTGHKKYEQFLAYVKVDDQDVNEAFKKF